MWTKPIKIYWTQQKKTFLWKGNLDKMQARDSSRIFYISKVYSNMQIYKSVGWSLTNWPALRNILPLESNFFTGKCLCWNLPYKFWQNKKIGLGFILLYRHIFRKMKLHYCFPYNFGINLNELVKSLYD